MAHVSRAVTRSITGVVLESGNNRPVRGCRIVCATADDKVGSAITQANGQYRIRIRDADFAKRLESGELQDVVVNLDVFSRFGRQLQRVGPIQGGEILEFQRIELTDAGQLNRPPEPPAQRGLQKPMTRSAHPGKDPDSRPAETSNPLVRPRSPHRG